SLTRIIPNQMKNPDRPLTGTVHTSPTHLQPQAQSVKKGPCKPNFLQEISHARQAYADLLASTRYELDLEARLMMRDDLPDLTELENLSCDSSGKTAP
ncbi:hypothetical protein PIB30_102720, partial [Stylosanthes scabra]|nr:hypothetical protein [Stylosanthes scabra]